jgi:polysaccharide pyruvyl transferase WcaK-like protein
MRRIPKPEKTIGVSLGVSKDWNGAGKELLKRFPLLLVRDFASFDYLQRFGIKPEISVDLLCALTAKPRRGPGLGVENHNPKLKRQWKNEVSPGIREIRLSSEDAGGKLYTDEDELLELFAQTEEAHLTRLHALVLGWIAGIPHMEANLAYDEKIEGFQYRVARMSPEYARVLINRDLDLIELCLKSVS